MGRGAEREKQTAKSVVFEGSGDVNTYTRRTTAKERLATASLAANCAEWRDVGTTRDCCTAFQEMAGLRKIAPEYQSFEGRRVGRCRVNSLGQWPIADAVTAEEVDSGPFCCH